MVTFEQNADGSVVGRLKEPVVLGEGKEAEEVSRFTIPRLRGKHMVIAPVLEDGMPIGRVIGWAIEVVEPKGVVGEMLPGDASAVAFKMLEQLKKSPATGGPNSAP